jgi:hypothetical protein
MNYLFILLGIGGVIFLYLIYSFLFPSKSKVASKNYLANGVQQVAFTKLENPSSAKYSIEVWIYANNLSNANSDVSQSGGVSGNPYGCIFEVSGSSSIYHLDLFADTTLAFYNNGTAQNPAITIPNFPLQRWVYVVISVDNTLVDAYLDGKLIRSMKTTNTGSLPDMNSNINFGKGDMYIAGMNRIASTTDTNTVFKNYMQGNAGLKLPGYSVSLDFLKNSSVAKNIPIM